MGNLISLSLKHSAYVSQKLTSFEVWLLLRTQFTHPHQFQIDLKGRIPMRVAYKTGILKYKNYSYLGF